METVSNPYYIDVDVEHTQAATYTNTTSIEAGSLTIDGATFTDIHLNGSVQINISELTFSPTIQVKPLSGVIPYITRILDIATDQVLGSGTGIDLTAPLGNVRLVDTRWISPDIAIESLQLATPNTQVMGDLIMSPGLTTTVDIQCQNCAISTLSTTTLTIAQTITVTTSIDPVTTCTADVFDSNSPSLVGAVTASSISRLTAPLRRSDNISTFGVGSIVPTAVDLLRTNWQLTTGLIDIAPTTAEVHTTLFTVEDPTYTYLRLYRNGIVHTVSTYVDECPLTITGSLTTLTTVVNNSISSTNPGTATSSQSTGVDTVTTATVANLVNQDANITMLDTQGTLTAARLLNTKTVRHRAEIIILSSDLNIPTSTRPRYIFNPGAVPRTLTLPAGSIMVEPQSSIELVV